jgi:hypothetical protein
MPYLYHSFVNPKADLADSTVTRPSDWNARFQYSNAAATGPSGTDASIREVLTADRTYYVRTDGSDSNTGLANTSGGAWLTGQHAMDVISGTLDFNAKNVTVQFGAGTYTAGTTIKPCLGQGSYQNLIFLGDTGTPSNVAVSAAGVSLFRAIAPGAGATIHGFKLSGAGAYALDAEYSGVIATGSMEFGDVGGGYHFSAAYSGNIIIDNAYAISGPATYHIAAQDTATLYCTGVTVTITNTPLFTTFCECWSAASVLYSGGVFIGGVNAGTKRFEALWAGVINTQGGGVNYFPGGVAGTVAPSGGDPLALAGSYR